MKDKKLDPEIRALLKDDHIKYQTAVFMNTLGKSDRPLLFRLFKEIKLGLNKQREIIEWLNDLMNRDGKKADAVLSQAGLAGILDDISLNGPQKGDLFRERLFDLRFPEVSAYLKRLKKTVSSLTLPERVKLIPVTPLEDGEFRLEISFNSVGELEEKLAGISRLVKDGALKSFWE